MGSSSPLTANEEINRRTCGLEHRSHSTSSATEKLRTNRSNLSLQSSQTYSYTGIDDAPGTRSEDSLETLTNYIVHLPESDRYSGTQARDRSGRATFDRRGRNAGRRAGQRTAARSGDILCRHRPAARGAHPPFVSERDRSGVALQRTAGVSRRRRPRPDRHRLPVPPVSRLRRG